MGDATHLAQRRQPSQEDVEQPAKPDPRPVFTPVEDRWRIGYQRNILNPYQQNVLKDDYPTLGQHTFFIFTGTSDTLLEWRELPVPSGVSTARPDSAAFFGNNEQFFARHNRLLRFELFEGDTAFKPPDWLLAVTPVLNLNHLNVAERGVVNPDVREGTVRTRYGRIPC